MGTGADTMTTRFNANQVYFRVVDERMKNTHCIGTAAHTGDYHIG